MYLTSDIAVCILFQSLRTEVIQMGYNFLTLCLVLWNSSDNPSICLGIKKYNTNYKHHIIVCLANPPCCLKKECSVFLRNASCYVTFPYKAKIPALQQLRIASPSAPSLQQCLLREFSLLLHVLSGRAPIRDFLSWILPLGHCVEQPLMTYPLWICQSCFKSAYSVDL